MFKLMENQDLMDSAAWMEFSFFSANVQHLLGELDIKEQLRLYDQARCYATEQTQLGLGATSEENDLNPFSAIDMEASIIVTFHFGYYRMVPIHFLEAGYRICILVSRDIRQTQYEYYNNVLSKDLMQRLEFLDAEDPHLFFKIRSQMDKGYHMVCYADGGTGTLKAKHRQQAKGLVNVDFMSGSIAVRSGYIDMAFLLRKNVALLFGPIRMKDRLTVREIYKAADGESRSDYVKNTLESIYKIFEQYLREYPYAWESWFYLHLNMYPMTKLSNWSNTERYMVFSCKEKRFLLDKYKYDIYPVNFNAFSG